MKYKNHNSAENRKPKIETSEHNQANTPTGIEWH